MNNVIFFEDNFKKFDDTLSPAIFLDRDGVIIKDQNYISDPDKVILEDGALKLIGTAFNLKWKVVIVTNQSGISRGYFDWGDYKKVTKRMIDLLGKPTKVTGIYANDVISDEEYLTWRKPSPKMLLQASKDLKINLQKSILIGDRLSDLKAGSGAGLKVLYHVLTGHGILERESIKKNLDKDCKLKIANNFSKVNFINSLEDIDFSIFKQKII